DDAVHGQTCALLEAFDGLFRRHVKGARDTVGSECLGHYKDTLKSSNVVTSRTDAECWTAIHSFTGRCSCRLSCRNFCENSLVFKRSSATTQTLPSSTDLNPDWNQIRRVFVQEFVQERGHFCSR